MDSNFLNLEKYFEERNSNFLNSLNQGAYMLAYANMAIDAIQNSKKAFLTTFIKEDSVRKPLEQFVESQGSFARQIAKTNWDFAEAVMTTSHKAFLNPKTDTK